MNETEKIIKNCNLTKVGQKYFSNGTETTKKSAMQMFKAVASALSIQDDVAEDLFNQWDNSQKEQNNKRFTVARVPSRTDKKLWSHYRIFIDENDEPRLYRLENRKTLTFNLVNELSAASISKLPKSIKELFADVVHHPEKYSKSIQDVPLGFYPNDDKENPQWESTPKNIADYFRKSYEDMVLTKGIQFEKEPKLFSNNPKTPNLSFFDLETLKDPKPTPTIDSFLSRFREDQKSVFNAWLYGLVHEVNTCRQSIYLQDNGYGGKSVMISAIAKFLGISNVATMTSNDTKSQFGFSKIYGKRLLVVPDLKNHQIIRTGYVHSITGMDVVNIERKGKDGFSAEIYAKVLIGSNLPPEIDPSQTHERSRLIFMPLGDYTKEELKKICLLDEKGEPKVYDGLPAFKLSKLEAIRRFTEELPYYIKKCEKDYKLRCETNQDFIISERMIEERNKICSDPIVTVYMNFMENYFEIDEDSYVTKKYFISKMKETMEEESYEFNFDFKSVQMRSFNKWLDQKYPDVKTKRVRINGHLETVYSGIRKKDLKTFTSEVEDEI